MLVRTAVKFRRSVLFWFHLIIFGPVVVHPLAKVGCVTSYATVDAARAKRTEMHACMATLSD